MEISKRNSFKILIHIIYGRSMRWPWYGMVWYGMVWYGMVWYGKTMPTGA
jgi:hypothetical protein